jgi:tetratricopeptide (TPR) repeat protein
MKKNKIIIIVSTALISILIMLNLILNYSYRSGIPKLPEEDNLQVLLENQIRTASRKAILIPSDGNLGKLGMIYHSSAYYDKAAVCYDLASRKNSSEWIWSYYLGCLNREMGESGKAIENFRAVVNLNPEAFQAWYYLGEIYQDLGQVNNAEDALSRISSLNKKKIPANEIFRIDHFPMGTYASYLLAKLYISAGQGESSEKLLNEVLKNSPDFGPAYRLEGSIYQTRGDSITALKYIQRASDNIYVTVPVDTLFDMISLMSRSDLFMLKQIDEADYNYYYEWALTLADRAFNYMPDNKYLISKTIKILLKTDKGETALPFLKKHLDSFKDDFEELKQVADLLYGKRYFAQSGDYYNRALELKPDNTEIQANLILGLLNEGNEKEALSLLDNNLKSYKDDPQVLANAVYIMLFLKKQDKAEFYLQQLIKLSPSDTKTLLLSGYIAQQKGDLNKARELFERSFSRDKKDLLAAEALGEILMKQKQWKKSIEHFKLSLDYFPNEPSIIEKLGSLLIICPDTTLRNYNEGTEYLARLLIHRTCPPEIKMLAGRGLARAYNELGDKTRATYYAGYTLNIIQRYNFSGDIIGEMRSLLE